ncbi:MAG: hypothetical protein AAGB00_00735 [Planctomycetota bacterium]
MRWLIALGLTATVAAPLGIWALADASKQEFGPVTVFSRDLIRTTASPADASASVEEVLRDFCHPRGRVHELAGSRHVESPEASALARVEAPRQRVWADRTLAPHLAAASVTPPAARRDEESVVAERRVHTGIDREGRRWTAEIVGGADLPTLVFLETNAFEGPGALTEVLADALRWRLKAR